MKMGKIEALGQTIKSQHGTVLAVLGYLQLCIIIAIIVLAILGNWLSMSIFSGVLIMILIFTYRYFSNVLTKGGLKDDN